MSKRTLLIFRIMPVVAIILASALVGFQVNAQGGDELNKVEETACPVEPDRSEIEGVTIRCGTITVPEDYDKPDGNQIDLVFAILYSTSLSPAPDPVIYLHGGPGAAELRELHKMSERFAPFRQTRDVVIFDQRGTGYSPGPLTCDVEYATQQDAIRDYVKEYARGSVNEDYAVNMAMFQACVERFEETEADLTQYNTINNARDVINVADALGYDNFNLYGFSYGTQLAMEVMRQEPKGLRSVILDSVAPADLKLYENFGQPNVEAITSLFAFCAEDDACNEAYPDLTKRFAALLDQLDEEPLRLEDGTPITANTVIAALSQGDIRPGVGAYFPLMIWELEQGALDTLAAILNKEVPPAAPGDFDPLALRYAGLDLPSEIAVIIDTALNLRKQAQQISDLAERLMAQGDEQIALSQVGASPAGRFDLLFHEVMNEQPFDRRIALNNAYLAFPISGGGPTVKNLKTFINANFSGFDANRLLNAADELSDDDVEALAEIIFGKARDYAQYFNVALALNLYVCQEHVPFNTSDGAWETFADLAIPQLGNAKFSTVQNLLSACQLFPTGTEPTSFHDPVVSEIPALILAGNADAQTAISWGEHAAESLENSEVVVFPQTGHGAIRYSQCAKDIGAAFINNPGGNLNTSCVEDLLPLFVLPPEEETPASSG